MAPSTAKSRSWRPCTSEQTPILTEHHSGLLHPKVGLFRLNAVRHPRRPYVLTHRAGGLRVAATPIREERRLGARHHASRQHEVSFVGELGLAVDVTQNAAVAASEQLKR
jgi:hypothetical protein